MPLEERTGFRDLVYSSWHRKLKNDLTWIDIDCCHYCSYCKSLLAFFELVRSPNEHSLIDVCRRKPASITERLGLGLNLPAYKVAYTGDPLHAAAIMQLGQRPSIEQVSSDELAQFIDRIHDCEFCRRNRGGRFARPVRSRM